MLKKLFAILMVSALILAVFSSCKLQNLQGSGNSTESSLNSVETESETESQTHTGPEQNISGNTASEKNETSSDSGNKNPNASQNPSGNNSSTSSKNQTSSNKTQTPTNPTTPESTTPTYPVITPTGEDYKEIKPIEAENYYGWQYLKNNGTSTEQKAYKAFEKAFSACDKTVEFDFDVKADVVTRVYDIYMEDHPEQFFLGKASYTSNSAKNIIRFTVTSDMMALGKDKVIQMRDKAQDKAYDIILKLFPNGVYKNDIETVRAVHDYLVNNIKYDTTHVADNSHDMYGALINGSAVCEGYAEAFLYILRMCGIECISVNGTMSGVSHKWNMVKLEGKWYHIDVTSDDPVLKSGNQVLRFEYFNLTDAEIKLTHVIEENVVDIPKATATKYNFFKYYGLEHSALNNDAFVNSISFSMKNGYDTAYFKFTNNTPSEAVDYYLKNSKAIAEIVNNNRFNKKIVGGGTVSYSQNKQKNILNLNLKYQ